MISSLSFLYLRSCAGESVLALELELDVLVLQAAQPLVGVGDVVEGLQHLGLELGLDGGERERALHVVLVEVALGGAFGLLARHRCRAAAAAAGLNGVAPAGAVAGAALRRLLAVRPGIGVPAAGERLAVGTDRRRHRLGVGPGIGRFEVDDVAQEDLALVELVAPDDDGLEGERALAQARDHGLAAGLDALGDGDLALAREQLHRAHLAQIHAHRIVGALGRLLGLGLGRDLLLDLDQLAALALGLVLGSSRGLLLVVARPPRSRPR